MKAVLIALSSVAVMALSLIAAAAQPFISPAYSGSGTGAITEIDITCCGNYDFRVYLGTKTLCGNSNTWAYLNATDTNYSSYVAALLAAQTRGTNVTIYANTDSNGYCHIGYISV